MPSRSTCRGCAPGSATPPASARCVSSGTGSMSAPGDAPSIRRRLLALLLVPTAIIAAGATWSAWHTALAPFEAAYDRDLVDAALAIASGIHARDSGNPTLTLSPDAERMLRWDCLD